MESCPFYQNIDPKMLCFHYLLISNMIKFSVFFLSVWLITQSQDSFSAFNPFFFFKSMSLSPFTTLQVDGPFRITLQQSSRHYLIIRTRNSTLLYQPQVRQNSSTQTLSLKFLSRSNIDSNSTLNVTIGYNSLTNITVSNATVIEAKGLTAERLLVNATGASTVDIKGVDVGDMNVTAKGVCTVGLAGKVGSMRVQLVDVSHLKGEGLQVGKAWVSVDQVSKVNMGVSDQLEVTASNMSQVTIKGKPVVNNQVLNQMSKLNFI